MPLCVPAVSPLSALELRRFLRQQGAVCRVGRVLPVEYDLASHAPIEYRDVYTLRRPCWTADLSGACLPLSACATSLAYAPPRIHPITASPNPQHSEHPSPPRRSARCTTPT